MIKLLTELVIEIFEGILWRSGTTNNVAFVQKWVIFIILFSRRASIAYRAYLLIIKTSIIYSFPSLMPTMPALALILNVQFMFIKSKHFWLIFSWEFALGNQQPWVIHGPLLDWLLLFAVMFVSVGCSSIRVESIAIGMKVIPSC